jgi:hypothetical protein
MFGPAVKTKRQHSAHDEALDGSFDATSSHCRGATPSHDQGDACGFSKGWPRGRDLLLQNLAVEPTGRIED